MIKLLHTADIHAKKSRAKDVVRLIDTMIEDVDNNNFDAVLITGDFWDCAVVNNSAFAEIIARMSVLISKIEVYMIYGTPHHEIANSLEVFKQLGAFVADKPTVWSICNHRDIKPTEKIDILGIPEPRKSLLLGSNADETKENVTKYLKDALALPHENPLLVMWHGEVTGAKYQNGVATTSDARLNGTMVKDAMAVLCGHIHMPQEVGKFNYCGSPIPVNFGELHKPSYNIVTIDNGKVDIKKRFLPFSQNRVVDCNMATFKAMSTLNFEGLNVKINLSLLPEERKMFKVADETSRLKELTKADNLKIVVKTENISVVRSAEIAKVTSNTEKLKIWAELNQIKLNDDIITKSESIQDDLLIKYNFPSHSFELMSLSLRGAKGIRSTDEINIDFSKYEDGILAVIGANGSGKSTLLEFASPYPQLLTRGGALRSHFYLKDSHRIIVYKDETGKLYKLSTFLAAHVDTGLVKYFAETSNDNGETWQTVKDCDGNLDTYKTYVEETFGSLAVYLRTAFFTRGKVKGISDIASATKGERIELLSQLYGTDNLSAMHDIVKSRMKDIEKDMELYSGAEDEKKETEEQIKRQNNNLERIKIELEETETAIADTEKKLTETKNRQEEFNKQCGQSGNLLQAKADNENRFIELTDHLKNLKDHKVQNDFFKANKDKIAEYKETYQNSLPMQNKIKSLSDKIREKADEVLELTKQVNDAKEVFDAEERKLASADQRIEAAKENTFDIGDVCPTCGAKLSAKRKADLLKAQEHIDNEIKSLVEWKNVQKGIVKEAKDKFNKLKTQLTSAEKKKKELESEYNELDASYQTTQAYLDIHEEYAEYMNYVEVSNLEGDIEKIEKQLKVTEDFLLSIKDLNLVDYKTQIENLEAKRKELEEDRLRLSVDKATTESVIKQTEEAFELLKEKCEKIVSLTKDYSDYSILEKAYANSGIQALELEAAIPEIATLTNSILTSSYGDKFQVAFSTVRQGKEKLVDDFCIDVTNTESGYTTPIELLSAGEKIWVIQSLYFAFSIIRMQRTGFSFKVRFIDESDGELDSEKRLEYIQMIKSVNEQAGSRLTVLVTHSQELKDLIQQNIQM